jgi:hypothetical protein
MHDSQVQDDIYKQLKSDIEQLRAEIKHERALRREAEANYESLKHQYEQAIEYIKNSGHKGSSNQGNSCLFVILLIASLCILILYFMTINVAPSSI